MTDDTLDKIRQFAADAKSGKPRKAFVKPERHHYRHGTVFCVDQSLSNTGWALLRVGPDGIHVPFCGLINPRVPTGTTGFSWSFGLAPQLFHEATKVLKRIDPRIPVAIEMPSVVGMRTESSLIAGNVLCCVLSELGREAPEVVSRQTVLANLVGYTTQNKTVTNAAVDRLVDSHASPWNEHVRDAVAIGLEWLREDQS